MPIRSRPQVIVLRSFGRPAATNPPGHRECLAAPSAWPDHCRQPFAFFVRQPGEYETLRPRAGRGISSPNNLRTTIGPLQAGRVHDGDIDAGSREYAGKLRGQTSVTSEYKHVGNSRAFRGHGIPVEPPKALQHHGPSLEHALVQKHKSLYVRPKRQRASKIFGRYGLAA